MAEDTIQLAEIGKGYLDNKLSKIIYGGRGILDYAKCLEYNFEQSYEQLSEQIKEYRALREKCIKLGLESKVKEYDKIISNNTALCNFLPIISFHSPITKSEKYLNSIGK